MTPAPATADAGRGLNPRLFIVGMPLTLREFEDSVWSHAASRVCEPPQWEECRVPHPGDLAGAALLTKLP